MCYIAHQSLSGLSLGPYGQAAIEQPSHPYSHNSGRVSRFASKASLMLPTITEDEAVEVCDMSGSPSWSSCISWSSGCQPYISCSRDYPVAYEGVVDWQSETEPDAEELLLAAIDERLQQLIAMRDQRHAAAALRAQRPVAPPAPAAPAVHGLAPAPAAPAAGFWPSAGAVPACGCIPAPARPAMQQQVCAEQMLMCQASAQMDAAPLAASMLQQMQVVQAMQMSLERELLELLARGY